MPMSGNFDSACGLETGPEKASQPLKRARNERAAGWAQKSAGAAHLTRRWS